MEVGRRGEIVENKMGWKKNELVRKKGVIGRKTKRSLAKPLTVPQLRQ